MPKKFKKLNETIDKMQIRLLSLDRLRKRVQEMLDADEVDEEDLEQLSAEVQRRLAKASKPETRTALQEIADRIYRHQLMDAVMKEEELDPWLIKGRHFGKRNDDFEPRFRGECMCSVPDDPIERMNNAQEIE